MCEADPREPVANRLAPSVGLSRERPDFDHTPAPGPPQSQAGGTRFSAGSTEAAPTSSLPGLDLAQELAAQEGLGVDDSG